MQNTAWARKNLQTYAGSWTELKHDTILYAKQSYAEMGGGGDQPLVDDRGYVEPATEVYARLAGLLKRTREGLEQRKLLSVELSTLIKNMEDLALKLKTISEKELRGGLLTDDEFELIRSYGGQLEHFWLEVNREDMDKAGSTQMDYLDQNPAALVADVATDPKNGKVLEEGTGFVNELYVNVRVDGQPRVAKGAVYSYYEFTETLANRLTDKKWRAKLKSDPPAMPDWTQSFFTN